MSRSSTAWRARAAETFSFPSAVLIAISERETALSSRIFSGFSKAAIARLLSRSGDSTAQIRITVSRSRRTSILPGQESFHFFVGHRLPPIRIEDLNLALEGSEHPLFASWLLRSYYVHHRHSPAAYGYGFYRLHFIC